MLEETIRVLIGELLFMTESEAQEFLDKHYPEHRVELHDDFSATVSGPELNFVIPGPAPAEENQ